MAAKQPEPAKRTGSIVKSGHVRFTLDVPDDLHLRVKIHAARIRSTMADLFNRWAAEGLNRDEQSGGGAGKRR